MIDAGGLLPNRALCTMGILVCLAPACGDDAGCSTIDAPFFADAPAPDPNAAPSDPMCMGTACGGDPTGVWQVVTACAHGTGALGDCTGSTLTIDDWHVNGTFTIDPDGGVTTAATERVTGTAHVQKTCYAVQTCRQLESLFAIAFAGAVEKCFPDGAKNACGVADEATSDACDCTVSLTNDNLMLNASIATSGNSITITIGNEMIPGEYCASGDSLWIHGTRFGSVPYFYRFQRKQN